MTTVRDLIAHLQRTYAPDDTIAAALWQAGDVQGRADERGLSISDERAAEILDQIDRQHDACHGITWETIDVWLDQIEKGGGS